MFCNPKHSLETLPVSLSHDGGNICSPDWPFADVGTSQRFLSVVSLGLWRMKGVMFVLGECCCKSIGKKTL